MKSLLKTGYVLQLKDTKEYLVEDCCEEAPRHWLVEYPRLATIFEDYQKIENRIDDIVNSGIVQDIKEFRQMKVEVWMVEGEE